MLLLSALQGCVERPLVNCFVFLLTHLLYSSASALSLTHDEAGAHCYLLSSKWKTKLI